MPKQYIYRRETDKFAGPKINLPKRGRLVQVYRSPCGSTSGSWTRLIDHFPFFRYEFIQEHLVEMSETLPDNRSTGAYRLQKNGIYRLFKENQRIM